VVRVTGTRVRTVLARYAVAWGYLGGFLLAGLAYAALPSAGRHTVLWWSSTDVENLRHHPVGCLLASAFVTEANWLAWPALIALALFGANRVLGNWRTAVLCAAGQVIGTLVSEGIEDYRVTHGLLAAADARILDVGPSYVVVSAATVALLYGSWWARVAAAADLLILIFLGQIFSGLTSLQVAAVGHATAIAVGVILGSLLAWQRRRSARAEPLTPRPLG
jgi:Rhomboid-like protein